MLIVKIRQSQHHQGGRIQRQSVNVDLDLPAGIFQLSGCSTTTLCTTQHHCEFFINLVGSLAVASTRLTPIWYLSFRKRSMFLLERHRSCSLCRGGLLAFSLHFFVCFSRHNFHVHLPSQSAPVDNHYEHLRALGPFHGGNWQMRTLFGKDWLVLMA
jgi:hypothetical protein